MAHRSAVRKATAKRKAHPANHVALSMTRYSVYGSPRIYNELLKEGWVVSERTVSFIMREKGLRSCMSRKFRVTTTDSNHEWPIAPNEPAARLFGH